MLNFFISAYVHFSASNLEVYKGWPTCSYIWMALSYCSSFAAYSATCKQSTPFRGRCHLDACISITRGSGRGLGPWIREFFGASVTLLHPSSSPPPPFVFSPSNSVPSRLPHRLPPPHPELIRNQQQTVRCIKGRCIKSIMQPVGIQLDRYSYCCKPIFLIYPLFAELK